MHFRGLQAVGQPRHLNPLASLEPFHVGCFSAGFAWLKWRAPPCHLPIFESLPVYDQWINRPFPGITLNGLEYTKASLSPEED